jgi:general secretion pathway protein G
MVDYNEMRKKFQPKKPRPDSAKRSSRAAIKAIAREYELKKAELQGKAPVMKKGLGFYMVVIIGMAMLASMVLSVAGKGGKAAIPRKALQARKSMSSLAVALGRYKFHTGEYPSTEEGLNALQAKSWRKMGWDGPYVNHIVNDPWGNEYVYETRSEGGHPVLYSKGPDGRAGTTDDVLPDQSQFDEPFRDVSWTNGWAPYRLRGVVVAPDALTKRKIQEEMKRYDPKPNGKK